MRGSKAKQLRKAAIQLSLEEHVPTRWAYRRLKQLYMHDPLSRKRFNA